MGIALFVIALVSNIFTILIVRFGFIGNYEYKQGMILVFIYHRRILVMKRLQVLLKRQSIIIKYSRMLMLFWYSNMFCEFS